MESVDGIEQLLSDISSVSSGSHSLDLEGISGVIISSGVVLSGTGINILSSLGQLGEVLEGGLVEEVGIGFQFLGRVLDFSEGGGGFFSVDDSENVGFQPRNNSEGFIVLLEGLNEHEGRVASVFSEDISLFIDILSSLVNPDEVLLGNSDFVFSVLSVSSSSITGGLILVSDVGQLSDLSSEFSFLGSVDLISLGLSINVLLFKISQDSQSGIDSIDGTGLHVE